MESHRAELRREIVVPVEFLKRWASGTERGFQMAFPIVVDWPELQLTSDQQFENSMARVAGINSPHVDHSIFSIVLPLLSRPETLGLQNED